MQTATDQSTHLDIRRNRARQQATQLVYELHRAGYIADYCRDSASWHLTDIFYAHDVEFTTAEQRKLAELSK